MSIGLDSLRLRQSERDCRILLTRSESEIRLHANRRHVSMTEALLRRATERDEGWRISRLCDLFRELAAIVEDAEDEAIRSFELRCQSLVKLNSDLVSASHFAREVIFEQSVLLVFEASWRNAVCDLEATRRLETHALSSLSYAESQESDFCSLADRLLRQSQVHLSSLCSMHLFRLLGQMCTLELEERGARFGISRQRLTQVQTLAGHFDDGLRLLVLVESDHADRRGLLLGIESESRHALVAQEILTWRSLGETFVRSSLASTCASLARTEYLQRLLHIRLEHSSRNDLYAHETFLLCSHVRECEESGRSDVLAAEATAFFTTWGDAETIFTALDMVSLGSEEARRRQQVVNAERLVLKVELAEADEERLQLYLQGTYQREDVERTSMEDEEDRLFVEICFAEELSWEEVPRRTVSAEELRMRSCLENEEAAFSFASYSQFFPTLEASARPVLSTTCFLQHQRLLSASLLELEVGIRETVSAEERSHWVALVPEAVFLHKICAKFACTVAQVQLYERLFRQEFADREVVHRETIVLCQETENAALFQDHQRRWKILVFLCVMFRRQVTERSSLSSDQDTARQSIIDTMRGVAAAKFIKRQQDLQSSWQIRRLRLHADFQDSYISLMREVGFELFFNHALLIAAEENIEYDKMMTYIKAEQEFLSQFLFYGLRLSDGRFDAISHEKNEYNCLRVLDSFPPSAPLIQSGDLVMSVNGVPSVSLKAMRRAISLSRPLAEFTVARGNGRVFTVQVQGTFKLMSRAVSVTSYTAEGYI